MLGVMSAKWVADAITHSLYHAIIEAKCLPFLNPEVTLHGVSDGELEKHSISALLKVIGESAGTVRTLRAGDVETFGSIAQCLSDSAHGCYPMVDKDKHFVGTVSRAHLASILVAASKGTADRLLTYEELLDDAHLLTHLDIDVALDAVRGGEARGAGDRMHGKRVTRLLPRPFISPPPPLASTAHLRSCSPLTPPTSTAHVHRSPPPLTSSAHPFSGLIHSRGTLINIHTHMHTCIHTGDERCGALINARRPWAVHECIRHVVASGLFTPPCVHGLPYDGAAGSVPVPVPVAVHRSYLPPRPRPLHPPTCLRLCICPHASDSAPATCLSIRHRPHAPASACLTRTAALDSRRAQHLIVTDEGNHIVGILTRKDLMDYRLHDVIHPPGHGGHH